MYLFSLSALLAYIPGKVPGLLLTANIGKKFNISPYLLGIGIFHFHLLSLGTVLFLFLITLSSILTIQTSIYFILLIFLLFISLVIMIHKILYLNKYLNYLIKKFNIQIDFSLNIKKEKILKILFLLCVAWIMISIGFFCLSLIEINFLKKIDILKLISIFFLSYLFGALTFIVPSGLGVFEVVIYFGLQNIMDENMALTLAACIRLIMITPAILSFIIYRFFSFIKKFYNLKYNWN